MSTSNNTAKASRPATGRRTLQELRRKAGYSNAKEFAASLGIPGPTYARYERQPESPENRIPMGAAWRIADALGCSIDTIVGHYSEEDEGAKLQLMYNTLTPESRTRLNEFLEFIQYREYMVAAQGRW